jgi:hypothetical protein
VGAVSTRALAAKRGEKAVTFHKRCGSGWLGWGRIYFAETSFAADTKQTSWPRIFTDFLKLLKFALYSPMLRLSKYAARENNC